VVVPCAWQTFVPLDLRMDDSTDHWLPLQHPTEDAWGADYQPRTVESHFTQFF